MDKNDVKIDLRTAGGRVQYPRVGGRRPELGTLVDRNVSLDRFVKKVP